MLTKNLVSKFLDTAGVAVDGHRPSDIRIKNDQFFERLKCNPSLAAGESYMQGEWDCDRLDELFYKISQHNADAQLYNKWHILLFSLLGKVVNLQSRKRSIEVAKQHYNLGNDFYRDMLGESMAYTCGYWKDAQDLDQAQFQKFDLICRKINIKPGDRILDLGCGWGTLAKFMAENYKCEVVAVNISTEQVRYAQQICQDLPVEVHLCDYRDTQIYNSQKKLFDKVVSIGLCEHIGHSNYQHFIDIALANIKADGLFLLHTIGKNDSTFFVDPWINKYIFPGGMLPSIKLLSEAIEGKFIIEDLHNFGADYDKTLMAWHKNFNAHWKHHQLQQGETFFRLWNYYLLSCAGAFRARAMQLWQIVLSPKGVLGGYKSIR